MTEAAGVEIVGGAEAAADYVRWADGLAHDLSPAARGVAERVAAVVRAAQPRRSGALAATVEVVTDEADAEAVGVGLGEGLAYAGWIEFGGGRGRPYIDEGRTLYPSAAAATDDMVAALTAATDDSIGRFSWSTPAT